jgi:8-oxo-dGTP pyrophosphatase MutT (NUDIX family)
MPSYYRDLSAPAPNRPRLLGVVALIEVDGSVLVDRRSDDGAWAFVGGRVEEDESVLDALRREVHEETGLEVLRADLLGVFSDPTRIIEYPDGSVHRAVSMAFVVVPQRDAAPRPSHESLELRFFARDDLATLPLWPAATPVRDAYLAFDGTPVIA